MTSSLPITYISSTAGGARPEARGGAGGMLESIFGGGGIEGVDDVERVFILALSGRDG